MKKTEDLSDRELQESSLTNLREINKHIYSMSIWIQIWSWIFAVGIAVYLFVTFAIE